MKCLIVWWIGQPLSNDILNNLLLGAMVQIAGATVVSQIQASTGNYLLEDAEVSGQLDLNSHVFAGELIFRRCVFDGSISIFRPILSHPNSDIVFDGCTIKSVSIQWPEWHHVAELRRRIIAFYGSVISEELDLIIEHSAGNPQVSNNGIVILDNCTLSDKWSITNGSSRSKVWCTHCTTAAHAVGSAKSSDLGGFIEFEQCDLDGLLTCGVYSPDPPDGVVQGIFGFCGSIVRGQVKLCTVSKDETLGWVDLRGVRIVEGNFAVSTAHGKNRHKILSAITSASDLIWKSSWDRSTIILDELLLLKRGARSVRSDRALASLPQRLAGAEDFSSPGAVANLRQNAYAQYDELQHSYMQTAGADDLEDFCKYRMSAYRSLCDTPEIAPVKGIALTVIFLAIFAVWFTSVPQKLGINLPNSSWLYLGILGVILLLRPISFFRYLFHQIFLKRLLGHGVILRRVFIGAFGVIAAFAVAYDLASWRDGRSTENGIFYNDGNSYYLICFDPPTQCASCQTDIPVPAGILPSYSRAAYFSTVTFTTLGYGDLVPRGTTRVLACAEVLTGAFYMSMVVVVLARRHLRM